MVDCCNITGNLAVNAPNVISANTSSSTEFNRVVGETGAVVMIGPTIGTLSVTGYASETLHTGCAGKATVSIPWIRKYDCDTCQVHFIFSGQGKATISGDVGDLASLNVDPGISYNVLQADISSGPATLYTYTLQRDGYGLTFNGTPWKFTTSSEDAVTKEILTANGDAIGIGSSMYLQSFNLTCTPGSIPIASYSFIFIGQNGSTTIAE